MIPLFYLPPGDQWDQTMLSRLLEDKLYHHGITFERHDDWPVTDGLVLVIPGRYWHDRTLELNDILTRYRWVLAIRTGDEEDLFDPASISHPHILWWVQTPRVDRDYDDAFLFGVGYSPVFADLPTEPPNPEHDIFLSAQNNHARRTAFFERLEGTELNAWVESTDGFTEGLKPSSYATLMMTAKAAPAPSGPHTPDTFRAYEALEAHTVPIVDDISTHNSHPGYWNTLYPDAPFPILTNLDDLVGYTQDTVADYPRRHNRVTAWWMRQKAAMSSRLWDDIAWLDESLVSASPMVTIVVPTSPIPSHPSAAILDETLGSIRHHFPTAKIILTFDGVRPEQEDRRADYEEYIRRALWRADHHWGNVIPVVFDDQLHQAEMMRRVLDEIDTPLVLYVEHDAPLVTDCEIDWEEITGLVLTGDFHSIRLYHEAVVPGPHTHLMHGRDGEILKTSQWSQRPHLTTKAFYRRVIENHFRRGEKSFIEDRMHGVVETAVREDGLLGWDQWRLGLYAPADDGLNNFKRSYHTDGRAGEDNYYS